MAIDPREQAKINAERKQADDKLAAAKKAEEDALALKHWEEFDSPPAQERMRQAQAESDAANRRIIGGLESVALATIGFGLAERGLGALSQKTGPNGQTLDANGNTVPGTSPLGGSLMALLTGEGSRQQYDANGQPIIPSNGEITGPKLGILLGGGPATSLGMIGKIGPDAGGPPDQDMLTAGPRLASTGADLGSQLSVASPALKQNGPSMGLGRG